MNVKTVAISLRVEGGLTLEDFLIHLNQQIIDLETNQALVIKRLDAEQRPNLWVGLLLRRKHQRVIPLIRILEDVINITPQELEEGTNKIDVNFFLINTNSQKGLFQTYHGAAPFSYFGGLLDTKLLHFCSIRREEAIINPIEVLKQDSLDDWLERVERIQQIIYQYEQINDRRTDAYLLKQNATSETVKLVFRKRLLNWRNIKNSLSRWTNDQNFSKLLVKGKTDDDLDKYYDLFENKQVLDMQDFDGYARGLRFQGASLMDSLEDSPNVANLVSLYENDYIRRIVDAIPND